MQLRSVLACLFLAATFGATTGGRAQASPVTVAAHDSVDGFEDGGFAAGRVLHVLAWEAGPFGVTVEETPGQDCEARITFASPKPSGDAGIDTVVLRWYRPPGTTPGSTAETYLADAERELPGAGVLLVHTLHPDLPVATMLARGLRQRGIHAFVIEMPGYASRVGDERRMTGVTALMNAAQAVGDCRRAFDAIAALQAAGVADVDTKHLAIQGTSLGSFVATSAAAIDGCFYKTFLLLCGGGVVDILQTGQKDAYHVRGALKHYGYDGDTLRELLDPVEPLQIAHRLDADTTWMFNASNDLVVPAKNARLLAEAIGLDPSHHVWMPGNHYTSFLLLPGVLDRIEREMHRKSRLDTEAEQGEPRHTPVDLGRD